MVHLSFSTLVDSADINEPLLRWISLVAKFSVLHILLARSTRFL